MLTGASLPLVVLALGNAGFILAAPTQGQGLSVAAAVPKDASPQVDVSFTGFAFETESFYLYATDEQGKPNTFSQNLMKDVLKRTGGTPILRVGGTSGDFGRYNATQQQPANPDGKKEKQLTRPPYLSIGKSWFGAFQNFPGMKFIFQVPLVHRNLTNTLAWAQQGISNIPDGALEALEIGNEPVSYSWFTIQQYVNEYLTFKKALVQKFPALGNGLQFQALDTQSAAAEKLPIATAVQDGINKTGGIKQYAYHYYQSNDVDGESLATLQQNVANHTRIVNYLDNYKADIAYLQQHSPGTPFVMSEVGNTLGNSDMHNRNVLATALWNVDWQLQCLAIGVTRVNMQQIFYPGYSMWQPQGGGLVPAGVNANYYSQPLVADFIGDSGKTQVAELDLQTHAAPDTTSGYAAYDSGKLARIALVNMHLWDGSGTKAGARPSASITLTLPSGTKSVTAQYLTAPQGAYAQDTLTYAGLQWQYPSGQSKQVQQDTRHLTVTDGKVVVSVNATSAVLLTL